MSKNFSRSEFACKCGCGLDNIDPILVLILQDIVEHFNDIGYINSGLRCERHNRSVGGSPRSQHPLGAASDLSLGDTPANRVQEYVKNKYPNQLGIGSYDNFTHIDTRPVRARW